MTARASRDAAPLLSVTGIRKYFESKAGFRQPASLRRAVDGVSFDLAEGETLGLVGESGCGKSTLARVIAGLYSPTEGTVHLRGRELHGLPRPLASDRGAMQMVFQDPSASLNPRLRVGKAVVEPLQARGSKRGSRARCQDLLKRVGLGVEYADRYPAQLSGGQQQRVAIARALIANPELIIFDEALSSLDVSAQAQTLDLISDLQAEFQTSYIFITHDLATATQLCRRIAIMYLGKFVEVVTVEAFQRQLLHPYSRALIGAALTPNPAIERTRRYTPLKGDAPDVLDPPSGCRFHPRCPHAQAICSIQEPPLVEHASNHWAACHFADEFEDNLERGQGHS